MKRLLTLTSVCLLSLTIGMFVRFPVGQASARISPQDDAPRRTWSDASTGVPALVQLDASADVVESMLSDTPEEYALVVPVSRIAVRAAASDTLREVPVRVGDSVSDHQVVAHLRQDEVRAEVKRRTAHVAVARCRIRAAQAEHELAKYELGLEEKLSRAHTAAQADLVAGQRHVEATAARLEAAREELAMAQHSVDTVEQSLDRYEVLAPFSGRITEVLCHTGQYVEEGDILLWIESQEKRLKLHLSPEQLDGREPPRVSILVRGEWLEVGAGVSNPGYNPDGTITVTFALEPSEAFVSGQMFPARVHVRESQS